MELMTAHAKAIKGMTEYGLIEKGWTFAFDRATSRLGQTNFSRKRITISHFFTSAATEEEFDQTLIHEMAHALLPVSAKHGALWKAKARSMGYKGGRTAMNPYAEAQAKSRANGNPAINPRVGNPQRFVIAQEANPQAPQKGDVLILPHGVKVTVTGIESRKVRAVEANGMVWNLSDIDAARLKRA